MHEGPQVAGFSMLQESARTERCLAFFSRPFRQNSGTPRSFVISFVRCLGLPVCKVRVLAICEVERIGSSICKGLQIMQGSLSESLLVVDW